GYDSIVAAAIALIGSVVGFTGGVLNPVNVGLSQQIVGVPLFSGMSFRIIIFVLTVAVASLYIMRYAKKVKNNPLNSFVYEDDVEKRKQYQHQDKLEVRTMTARQKYASFAALLFMGI
ncbi:YfcC family protein, partial [Staphylococcus sp. SIMBA_130]